MDSINGGGSTKVNKNLMYVLAIVVILIIMMDLWFVQKMILFDKIRKEHMGAVHSNRGSGLKYATKASFLESQAPFEKKEYEFYKKYYL